MSVVKHPAKFSDSILTALSWIPSDWLILDPFAGVGGVHTLGRHTIGIEIEPEWASVHQRTIVGSAFHLPFKNGTFDAIVTSCTYGNRMADHHNAKDDSKRLTYRHTLGRALHPQNTGQLQWGSAYKQAHVLAWNEAMRVLKKSGFFVLNVSNHIRKGAEIDVVGWHRKCLTDLGMAYRGSLSIPTQRMKYGANSTLRVGCEKILVFQRPPLPSLDVPRYSADSRITLATAWATPEQEMLVSDTDVVVSGDPEAEDGYSEPVSPDAAPVEFDVTSSDPVADAAAAEEVEEPEKKERRPRGWLENDVKQITDKFVQGEITLPEGGFLTPHRIAKLVKELDALDEAPSAGAVAAVLNRWVALGFITVNDKPFAFVNYTDLARTEGLSALKANRSATRKAERAAAKAAAAPVASPETVSTGDASAVVEPATEPIAADAESVPAGDPAPVAGDSYPQAYTG